MMLDIDLSRVSLHFRARPLTRSSTRSAACEREFVVYCALVTVPCACLEDRVLYCVDDII